MKITFFAETVNLREMFSSYGKMKKSNINPNIVKKNVSSRNLRKGIRILIKFGVPDLDICKILNTKMKTVIRWKNKSRINASFNSKKKRIITPLL